MVASLLEDAPGSAPVAAAPDEEDAPLGAEAQSPQNPVIERSQREFVVPRPSELHSDVSEPRSGPGEAARIDEDDEKRSSPSRLPSLVYDAVVDLGDRPGGWVGPVISLILLATFAACVATWVRGS